MAKRIEIGDFRRTVPEEVVTWLTDSGVDLDRWVGYDLEKFCNSVTGVLHYVQVGLIEDNFLGRKVLEEWENSLTGA